MVRLATDLAAKHASGGNPTPLIAPDGRGKTSPKGGRRTVEAEARDWLARNNLQAVPLGSPMGTAPDAPLSPAYVVDPQFVKTAAETLLKGVSNWEQRKVYRAVFKRSEDANLAKEFASEAGAPPGCIDVLSFSLGELTQKYPWLGSMTPEGLCVAGVLVWVTSSVSLHSKLDKLLAPADEKEVEK